MTEDWLKRNGKCPYLLFRGLTLRVAVAAHALVYSVRLLFDLWARSRSRLTVALYALPLLIGICHPALVWHFWSRYSVAAEKSMLRECAAIHDATDHGTIKWVTEQPADWIALLVRANFLVDTGRDEEAIPIYERVIVSLPPEREVCRAGIENLMAQANASLEKRGVSP